MSSDIYLLRLELLDWFLICRVPVFEMQQRTTNCWSGSSALHQSTRNAGQLKDFGAVMFSSSICTYFSVDSACWRPGSSPSSNLSNNLSIVIVCKQASNVLRPRHGGVAGLRSCVQNSLVACGILTVLTTWITRPYLEYTNMRTSYLDIRSCIQYILVWEIILTPRFVTLWVIF